MLRGILLLMAGYKLYTLAQQARANVSFEFLFPKRGDIDLGDEEITLRIKVRNDNPIGFPINSVKGVLKKDDRIIGEVNSTQIHNIEPNSVKILQTVVGIESENIFFQIADNLSNGTWNEPIEFVGEVYIGDRKFNVRRKIRFFQ